MKMLGFAPFGMPIRAFRFPSLNFKNNIKVSQAKVISKGQQRTRGLEDENRYILKKTNYNIMN